MDNITLLENRINDLSISIWDNISKKITNKINKEEKKANGIYFTPKITITKTINRIMEYLINVKTVLEPSCGSCEFINAIDNKLTNIEITGIELNNIIYNEIKNLNFNEKNKNNIQLINVDFLEWNLTDNKSIFYDLIIGNPPYFVIKKNDKYKDYYKYFDGRPNIFILFIIKCLKYLAKNGILTFILPNSFMNCLYYNKLRKYINDNYTIIDIIECDNKEDIYIDTKQQTIIFIIKNNKSNNNEFIMNIQKYIIFNTKENIIRLKELYHGAKTLKKLNFTSYIGNIVWNQNKTILTTDNTKTRLIYSSDIIDLNKIQIYNNTEKKNYINKNGNNDTIIVINRGYGVGNYKFNYSLIDVKYSYLIENHLICIKYNGILDDKDEIIILYNNIIKSFNDDRTKEFIVLYFKNSAINTTELNNILPIYF